MSPHKKSLSKYLLPLAITGVTTIGINIGMVLSASAQTIEESFIPQSEGEVNLFGCIDPNQSCFDLPSLFPNIASVESLPNILGNGTQEDPSRLFVDKAGTRNKYKDVNGNTVVDFKAFDIGTSESNQQYWFRPVDNEEKGQGEWGIFRFVFANSIDIMINYFDTESNNSTGLVSSIQETGYGKYNVLFEGSAVPAGRNGNTFTQTWTDVSEITLKLGKDYVFGTGDGVNFQIVNQVEVESGTPTAVPEPLTMLGAGAAISFGGFFKRKLAKSSNKENKA